MQSEFVDYALRQLQVLGPITAKRMFGAQGLYLDGVFFAVIYDDALYLKVDDQSRQEYVAAGMGAFQHRSIKRPMDGYYELPLDVLGDRKLLTLWGEKALAAARAKNTKKPAARAEKLKHLGSVSLRWLAEAGIHTRADLERLGSVAAFKQVAAAGHDPSAVLLFALEGLLLGLRSNQLSVAVKENLLERAGLGVPGKSSRARTKPHR